MKVETYIIDSITIVVNLCVEIFKLMVLFLLVAS